MAERPTLVTNRHARRDLAAVGLPTLADEQVVGRQLARLLLRPLDAAEGVGQPVARALPSSDSTRPARLPASGGRLPGWSRCCATCSSILRSTAASMAASISLRRQFIREHRVPSAVWPSLDPGVASQASDLPPARLPRRRGPRSGCRGAGIRVPRRAAPPARPGPAGRACPRGRRRRTVVHFDERLDGTAPAAPRGSCGRRLGEIRFSSTLYSAIRSQAASGMTSSSR